MKNRNINGMVVKVLEIIEECKKKPETKYQVRPEAMCTYFGISIATWNRWIAGDSFTNQYDRLMKVHDFNQHPEKYIKGYKK